MSTVRRFEHMDFAPTNVVEDGEFLRVDGKVARCGIQEYRDSVGGVRRELRMPGDVKASVPGFELVPLTNTHPASMVKPENARQHVIGAVGAAKFDGQWVTTPLAVYTADAIAAVKSGRVQLSTGYQCEVVDEPGEYEGQRYDGRQVNIKINHVALVDVARAGPEARLHLDSGDAVTGDFRQVGDLAVASHQQELTRMPIKVKLDGGFEVEVADANASAAIEGAIEKARQDGLADAKREKERADKAELSGAELSKKNVELQATLDSEIAARKADADKKAKCDECSGTGKMDGADCKGCEGKGEMKADAALDPQRRADSLSRMVASRAAQRAALLRKVGEDLSQHEKLDDKSDAEIKRLWLDKRGTKLDGKDDAYVSVYFDAEMARAEKERPTALAAVRLVNDPEASAEGAKKRVDAGPSLNPDEARRRNHERTLNSLVK